MFDFPNQTRSVEIGMHDFTAPIEPGKTLTYLCRECGCELQSDDVHCWHCGCEEIEARDLLAEDMNKPRKPMGLFYQEAK